MNPIEQLRAEMARFEAALPALLETHPGKWVVFREGQVVSVHDTEDEACRAGLAQFGHGGQVVAQIVEPRTVPLSASVLYQRRA